MTDESALLLTDAALELKGRLEACRYTNDQLRKEKARQQAIIDTLLAACVAFSDAHYIEDNRVSVDPHDWGKFDAAIAAARPTVEPEIIERNEK